MVEVTYYCPYCGAVTGVEREGYLRDKCVTREPLAGWEYAATTDDVEAADGIEFVCLGDAGGDIYVEGDESEDVEDDNGVRIADGPDADVDGPAADRDGCGRTFYLSYVKYEDGTEVEHRRPAYDRPRFDFSP